MKNYKLVSQILFNKTKKFFMFNQFDKKQAKNLTTKVVLLLLTMLSFLVAIWKPDLYHDGFTFYSATALQSGLVAGRDYYEMYGVISSFVESILLALFYNNLIVIRAFGVFLNLLISRQLYVIGRVWLSNRYATLVSVLWLLMNPVWTSLLRDNLTTAQTWPNQYGILLSCIVLKLIVTQAKITTPSLMFISASIALLPFIRIQFFAHSFIFLVLLVFFKKISNYVIFLFSICIMFFLIMIVYFENIPNVFTYFSNMLESQDALRPTLYSGLPRYYLNYLEISLKVSLFSLLMLLFLLAFSKLLIKSLAFSGLKISAPLMIFVMTATSYFILMLGTYHESNNQFAKGALTWFSIVYPKIPHLILYAGFVTSIFVGCLLFVTNKRGRQNIIFVTGISWANAGLLYDIPDVGRFWSSGGLFILIMFIVISKAMGFFKGEIREQIGLSIKSLLSIVVCSSILSIILLLSEISNYHVRLSDDSFRWMVTSVDQDQEIATLTLFTERLKILVDTYGDNADIYCHIGFAHISDGRILGNSPFWQKYQQNQFKVESLIESESLLLGACDLSNNEKDKILDLFGEQAEFFSDYVIIDKRK